MQRRKAFTLIELLVVIAIIAILAAILFPVFAQAKAAAKKTQEVSNVKQTTLGLIMYSGDADDTMPNANKPCVLPCPDGSPNSNDWAAQGSWWGDGSWAMVTQPYMKNLAVFAAPGDDRETPGWVRPAMGFAINAYVDGFWDNHFGAVAPGGNWDMTHPNNGTIGRPAETILLGERHSNDYGPKRVKAFGGNNEGHAMYGNAPFLGVPWSDAWLGPGEIPDAKADPNAAWPNGRDGTTTPAWSGNAVFSFVDGHAKAMKPAQTVPDKWDGTNMWDGSRK